MCLTNTLNDSLTRYSFRIIITLFIYNSKSTFLRVNNNLKRIKMICIIYNIRAHLAILIVIELFKYLKYFKLFRNY